MNWTLVYPVYALHGLIDKEHYECWRSFVLACRLLTLRVCLTWKADLLHFGREVESLHGKQEVSPNVHPWSFD